MLPGQQINVHCVALRLIKLDILHQLIHLRVHFVLSRLMRNQNRLRALRIVATFILSSITLGSIVVFSSILVLVLLSLRVAQKHLSILLDL